ncbi:MAG TPA: AraD1 family protein [Parafilimonas sp.]|nr:AraD1 family protein [Parafilimonas sp.]
MIKLIQFIKNNGLPGVGVVNGDKIELLNGIKSTYELFVEAQQASSKIEDVIPGLLSGEYEYYPIISKEQRLLLPLIHPDPYHTWITGTGLTHLGSAASRNAMHEKINAATTELTDSIKMFQIGLKNGKMENNIPAAQPEWFYKGNGLIAVNPGKEITSPSFALDGGEEPEIVGIYIIDKTGNPVRIGFSLGNEFSDHVTEKINYLYLAHSKLRQCSYGPELLIADLPKCITGKSKITRNNKVLWEKEFLTGEDNMSHNIRNLEYHHFKYEMFRQPGDVHVHFFGTSVLSFSDQVKTEDGDIFHIEADAFEHALVNPLKKLNSNQ